MHNEFETKRNFDSAWFTILTFIGFLIVTPITLISENPKFSTYPETTPHPVEIALGMWSFFMANLFFSNWGVYLLFCVGMLLSGGFVFFQKREGYRRKALVLLGGISILAFMLLPYEPAVLLADSEDEMLVLTEPSLLFRGLKRAQAIGEMKSCDYRILGWQNSALFYESTCSASVQTWRYDVGNGLPVSAVNTIENDRLFTEQFATPEMVERFRISVHPPELEESVIHLALRDGVVLSPDQEWVAVVAQHTVYGPKDVIVLKTSPHDASTIN